MNDECLCLMTHDCYTVEQPTKNSHNLLVRILSQAEARGCIGAAPRAMSHESRLRCTDKMDNVTMGTV